MPTLLAQAELPPAWWMTEFRSYSIQHLIVILSATLAVVAAVALARRWRTSAPRNERIMRTLWALGIIPFQLWSIIFWMLPANYSIRISLPLHICDLIVWIVPIALLTSLRWARTLVYFVGIGMSILAFVTPVLEEGAATWHFWLFWIGHTQIVGSSVYIVAVMGYIPTRRDLIGAMLICLGYAAVIIPFDAILDVNYGYIGPLDTPPVVTEFGPWPQRLIPMITLMFAMFTVMWLPWAIRSRLRHKTAEQIRVDVPARDDHADA